MKKIAWFDDEHCHSTYDDYLFLFKQRGYDLLLIDNPITFFNEVDQGSILSNEIVCLVVDLSFKSVDGFVAAEGIEIGRELIKKLKSTKSLRNDVKIVVYTSSDTKEIRSFCENNDIIYLQKLECYEKSFVKEIIKVITKSNKK